MLSGEKSYLQWSRFLGHIIECTLNSLEMTMTFRSLSLSFRIPIHIKLLRVIGMRNLTHQGYCHFDSNSYYFTHCSWTRNLNLQISFTICPSIFLRTFFNFCFPLNLNRNFFFLIKITSKIKIILLLKPGHSPVII